MNNIKIIGLGGAGINTINYIKNHSDFYCVAADFHKRSLSGINADKKILLSENVSADEFMKKLRLECDDKIFLVAGLGGKCGSRLARLASVSIPGIVRFYAYTPYIFEGKRRNDTAAECIFAFESSGGDIVKLDNNLLLNKTGSEKGITVAEVQKIFYEKIYNDICEYCLR